MRLLNIILIIFIALTNEIKADSKNQLFEKLQKGGNLIFIRHAYAPGGGDPENFDIKDCKTQRNLNDTGRYQAKKIGYFFKTNNIPIDKVFSSEWCRCTETALLAFNNFKTQKFLNSFFSLNHRKNKKNQIKNLKKFIKNWNGQNNLILISHYVVIKEVLDVNASSGEIIVADLNYKMINRIQIEF